MIMHGLANFKQTDRYLGLWSNEASGFIGRRLTKYQLLHGKHIFPVFVKCQGKGNCQQ